jgi:hypothetical protein
MWKGNLLLVSRLLMFPFSRLIFTPVCYADFSFMDFFKCILLLNVNKYSSWRCLFRQNTTPITQCLNRLKLLDFCSHAPLCYRKVALVMFKLTSFSLTLFLNFRFPFSAFMSKVFVNVRLMNTNTLNEMKNHRRFTFETNKY